MTDFRDEETLKLMATMLDKGRIARLLFRYNFSSKEVREMMGLPKNSSIYSYQRKCAARGAADPKLPLSKDDVVALAHLYREGQDLLLSLPETESV